MENSLWDAPRIHGELLKLGIEVAQSTVAKYLIKHRLGSGQTWRRFCAIMRLVSPCMLAAGLFSSLSPDQGIAKIGAGRSFPLD